MLSSPPLHVEKLRQGFTTSGPRSGDLEAPSWGLSTCFRPLELAVPQCHIQLGPVSPVPLAQEHFLAKCPGREAEKLPSHCTYFPSSVRAHKLH